MARHCIYIICLLALASCADDTLYIADSESSPIAFAAEITATSADSRGSVTDVDNLDVFAVSASVTDADGPSVYFAHETYQLGRVGDQVQTTLSGQTHYWLDRDAQYDFYAYSPSTDLSFAEGVIDRFDYVVNDDVAKQADIVVSAVVDAPYGQKVPLKFVHPLSKISLSQGAQMAGGTIQSVTFSGIIGKGVYDMGKSQWSSFQADTTTYTYDCSAPSAPKTSITGTDYNFFFIPQTLGEKACLRVKFVDTAGATHYYEKALTGEWTAGAAYNYTLSVTPQLDLEATDSIVDAYYSIVKVKVQAPGIASDTDWAVTVAASDGADVTAQWQEHVNSFAKLGFWTDNYIVNGTATQSARGTSTTRTVSGSGTDYVYVFVPENTGTTDRKITVSAVSGSSVLGSTVITQKCPAWSGNVGWSQLADSTLSDFGFDWDRSLTYVLPYSVSDYGLETDFSKTAALSLLDGMISLGDASTYTRIATYYTYHIDNVGTIWHYYLDLDYTLCNSLIMGSSVNGLQNTLRLYEKGGTAATGTFQLMVMRAVLAQSVGQTLFRLPSSAYSQENAVPRPAGIDNLSLSALCKVLKHNRYNYSVTQVGSAVVEYPSISTADIVWYLPAVEQFKSLPRQIASPIRPAECWSSTALAGATRAYLGSGAVAPRALRAQVRCCRTR